MPPAVHVCLHTHRHVVEMEGKYSLKWQVQKKSMQWNCNMYVMFVM